MDITLTYKNTEFRQPQLMKKTDLHPGGCFTIKHVAREKQPLIHFHNLFTSSKLICECTTFAAISYVLSHFNEHHI